MSEFTCPTCGKRLTEYVRFCPECGSRLPDPPAAAAPASDPAAPATPPPGGLRTVVLPPEAAPPAPGEGPDLSTPPPPAAEPAGIAPTMRLDAPAQPAAAVPALPTAAPPAGAFPPEQGAPAAPRNRRTLWWILGGAGCLVVLLAGACLSIGLLTLLGQRVENGELSATPLPATGGGGIVPDDSPLTGGTVLIEDDFSDPATSDLDVSEDETSRSAYEDGSYLLEVKEPETLVWSIVGGPYEDVSIEVEAAPGPGAAIVSAGLVFHYQDSENFYLYSVSTDGYYALELLQDGEWITLVDPTLSDEVTSEGNLLRVVTSGDQIALYVNDVLLEETSDGTFTSGDAGVAVSTFEESPGTVQFDNLVVARGE